jgi:pyrroloquinoline quinone (PQQ) biosynthesis protein C
MKATEWRSKFNVMVREWITSPEMEQFYGLKFSHERAKLYMTQLSLYVQSRRSYWLQIGANCPHMDVKKRILEHEYEEAIKDEHSPTGHLDLVVRQGAVFGLSAEQILNPEPIPSSRAAFYAWGWIARHKPWTEAIAASTSSEGMNDDRLLRDLGGGSTTRLAKMWAHDLDLRPEQMPHFTSHSKADEKHSDMFTDMLEQYVRPEDEDKCLGAVKESFDIMRSYFGGMAATMLRLP